MASEKYYIYVLYCADNSFYCGFTNNVKRRFHTHQTYQGAKYTRVKKRHPLKLIYSEKFESNNSIVKSDTDVFDSCGLDIYYIMVSWIDTDGLHLCGNRLTAC